MQPCIYRIRMVLNRMAPQHALRNLSISFKRDVRTRFSDSPHRFSICFPRIFGRVIVSCVNRSPSIRYMRACTSGPVLAFGDDELLALACPYILQVSGDTRISFMPHYTRTLYIHIFSINALNSYLSTIPPFTPPLRSTDDTEYRVKTPGT